MSSNNISPVSNNSSANQAIQANSQPKTRANVESTKQTSTKSNNDELINKLFSPEASVDRTESNSRTDEELIDIIDEDRLWALENPSEWKAINIASTIQDPIKEERECAQQHPKTPYASGLAQNIKKPSKKESKVARDNPNTLYAHFIAHNIKDPSSEENEFAHQNPETEYAHALNML